jgi:hypothetical protein
MEVWNLINDNPWKRATEIDDFVHDEGHDTSGKHIVLHVCVPRSPKTLEDIQVDIVLADLVELSHKSICLIEYEGSGGVPGHCLISLTVHTGAFARRNDTIAEMLED